MKSVFVCLLFVCCYASHAQQFSGFPPSTHWKQINTDTARIIFDVAAQKQAERIATIIQKAAAETPNALGKNVKKINIVLHSNTTLANGYVALAPFRSEYYLIPSSNVFELGNLPWYEHLAVHEYRHVQQYNNFNHGLTKAFDFVLGQEGQALANSLTIPNWFFEGDAVHAETALTLQGRGRLPLFLSGYNSLWRANKNYRLMKLLNGSLKDYVPNHYQFGYLVVNYGYEKYGPDFWQKVTADASAFKGLIYPFRKAIKQYSGTSYHQFIANALEFYKQKIQPNPQNNSNNKTVTNYYFPQLIGHDSLVYLKDSYNKLPAFYVQDKNGEHRVKLRNISSEDWFAYRNGQIAYTAFDANARWSLIDYSNIILLDIKTGNEKKLSTKQKYFTPDIAPSGKTIVAISINEATETEIHLLNSEDGSLIKKIRPAKGDFFLHPRFIDEENMVLCIRKPNGSISLNRMNLTTEKVDALTPSSFNVLGYPSVKNDTVFFTAAFDANDDLYALPLKTGKVFQLTTGVTGNYYANASGESIVWSQFTAHGLQLKSSGLTNMRWTEVNPMHLQEQALMYPVADASQNILQTPTRHFAVSDYKKGTGLLNFHSWRPYYEDPEFTFSVYSDNVLNTFSNEIYYRYNQNEQSHGLGFTTAYGALFPVLTVGAEYTFDRHVVAGNKALTLNQYELKAGYYIPLNFTGGNTNKLLTFGSQFVFNRQMPSGVFRSQYLPGSSSYLLHFVNWTQQLLRAAQHIYPKFGYSLSAEQRHRLDGNGYQSLANGRLYLPSFGNHSIVLAGSFQQTDTNNVRSHFFSNRFANSRGYTDFNFSRMWRASANYHFPIAYPDWGFGGLVYFLRVRANLFYDYTRMFSNNKTKSVNLRSAGTEVYFDTKWWNQLPVSFGIRYSHLLDAATTNEKNKNVWEIVIPMSLIPQ